MIKKVSSKIRVAGAIKKSLEYGKKHINSFFEWKFSHEISRCQKVAVKIELFTTGRMTITNYEKTLKICKIVVHSSKSIQIKIVKSSLVNQVKNGSRGGTVMKDMQNWQNLATLVVVIFHTELFYDPRFFFWRLNNIRSTNVQNIINKQSPLNFFQ